MEKLNRQNGELKRDLSRQVADRTFNPQSSVNEKVCQSFVNLTKKWRL